MPNFDKAMKYGLPAAAAAATGLHAHKSMKVKGESSSAKDKRRARTVGSAAIGGVAGHLTSRVARLAHQIGKVEKAHGIKGGVNPRAVGALVGAAGMGGLNYVSNRAASKKDLEAGGFKKKSPATAALIGGVLGGGLGYGIGGTHFHRLGGLGGSRPRGSGGYAPPPPRSRAPAPDWLKNVKTKAEAQKSWRNAAKKHHPDAGGNLETMKKINGEWEAFKRSDGFDKLAGTLPSFFEELLGIYGQ